MLSGVGICIPEVRKKFSSLAVSTSQEKVALILSGLQASASEQGCGAAIRVNLLVLQTFASGQAVLTFRLLEATT